MPISPVTEPTASTFVREVGRDEDAAARVVLDARAGLGEEGVRGLAAAGGDEEVAVDRAAVELDGAELAALAVRGDLADARRAEVDDLGDLGSRLLQVVDDGQRAVVCADHDRALTRLERPEVHEPPDAARAA